MGTPLAGKARTEGPSCHVLSSLQAMEMSRGLACLTQGAQPCRSAADTRFTVAPARFTLLRPTWATLGLSCMPGRPCWR